MEPLLYRVNSYRAERFSRVKEDFNLLSTDKNLYFNNWVRKNLNCSFIFFLLAHLLFLFLLLFFLFLSFMFTITFLLWYSSQKFQLLESLQYVYLLRGALYSLLVLQTTISISSVLRKKPLLFLLHSTMLLKRHLQ